MEFELTEEAKDIKSRGGHIGVDGERLSPARAAELAALPELTTFGAVVQKSGPELLREIALRALDGPDADPGYREVFPYREVDFDDGNGQGAAKRLLHAKLPYEKGNQTFNPPWEIEVLEEPKRVKEGEPEARPTIKSKTIEAPYIVHARRFQNVRLVDGVVQLDNPECPTTVVDEYLCRTDDLRKITLRLAPDADHKELVKFGCHADQSSMGWFRKINQAKIGANAWKTTIYTVSDKGWFWFPGCARPYYAYADQVICPDGGPEARAVTRSGNGAPPTMGVQVEGSFQTWKAAIKLVLQNPAMACLLGFAASSPLLGLIKEMEAGIVHLVGGSGHGKTTALKVAASLIGSADGPREASAYVRSWNSTANAVEGPLEARSDAPSFYDELYELPQNVDVLALLYRVANGRGKERMTKDIETRPTKNWRTQIISTGEGSFASRLSQEGHEYFPGGLQFRVPEIHIDSVPFWSHVEAQAALPNHGAYKELVEASRASAPTPQARIVEAIELALKANHGHFWPRWIARLQSEEGAKRAADCFEAERNDLEASIPPGANSVYVRRSKHVAASMAGLVGILGVCEFGEEFDQLALANARSWAKSHLWSAGIDIMAAEGESIYDRLRNWLSAHESDMVRVGDSFARSRPSIGWIERDGGCRLPAGELKKIAAQLKIDCGRLEKAMSENGWGKDRKRHPGAGRVASALSVWRIEGLFAALDAPVIIAPSESEPPPSAQDVFDH